MKQSLFGQDQVHGAHAAKTVKGLQLGHTVLPFFKFTYKQMPNHELGPWGIWFQDCGSRSKLTGEYEARQRNHVKLLHCDLIAVHEKVQQVNSQVSCCGAQPEVVAHNGDKVGKVPS